MKIIIVIFIPAPLLALSQAMCLTPAFCPCSGLGGWEEQAEILAAALASKAFFKQINGRMEERSPSEPPCQVVVVSRSPCPEGQVILEVDAEIRQQTKSTTAGG